MRPVRKLCVLLTLGLMAIGAAGAEEIVHFTNGTYLSIRSHTVEGGMIHVVLGDDFVMAFPMSVVERVEEAGKEIPLTPGSSRPANKAVEGSDGTTPDTGIRDHRGTATMPQSRKAGSSPARRRAAETGSPGDRLYSRGGRVEPEGGQVKERIECPFANHPNLNRRKIAIAGDRSALRAGGGILKNPKSPGRRFQAAEFRARSSSSSSASKSSKQGGKSQSGGDSSSEK